MHWVLVVPPGSKVFSSLIYYLEASGAVTDHLAWPSQVDMNQSRASGGGNRQEGACASVFETDQLKAEGLAGWAGLLSVRVSIYREGL